MGRSAEARAREYRVQMLGGLYGVTFAAGLVVFTQILPQPWFGVAFWLLMALSMVRFAVVIHRRMRLPLTLFASVNGVLMFATFALLHAQGIPLASLPNPWFWMVGCMGLVIAGLFFIERVRYRAEYEAWIEFMADKSFLDMLLLRHIPDLRRH